MKKSKWSPLPRRKAEHLATLSAALLVFVGGMLAVAAWRGDETNPSSAQPAATELPGPLNGLTILVDAGNGRYGTAFHEALTKEAELGWLISYSGFLDMAIVTGTAMSHGVARYAFLQHGQQTDITEKAFCRRVSLRPSNSSLQTSSWLNTFTTFCPLTISSI